MCICVVYFFRPNHYERQPIFTPMAALGLKLSSASRCQECPIDFVSGIISLIGMVYLSKQSWLL